MFFLQRCAFPPLNTNRRNYVLARKTGFIKEWIARCITMESYDIIANQPVVIDNGSGVVKAGFAGDQIPKYCFPNYVGRPKHVRVMAGALEGDLFIGPKAEEHRGLLSVRYPMEHGIVKDWNDMERIWQYVYSKEQLQTFSEEHPVLLTEAPLNPSKNRERAAEVFFETFNVPALFISMQAVLSLYATGRTTGVVLDAGDGVTHAVPIYEGFAIPHSIMRVDIAGRDVSRYLRLLLRKEGYDFHTSAEFEVVRTIKERACYLSLNPQKDETLETEKAQYTLPDGSTLDIGPARFRAPELLFRPDLIGDESEGIHEVLAFAIQKSDMDLRRTLFSNIVLSGGSTLLKGFGDRLLSEVKKLAPKDVKIKVFATLTLGTRLHMYEQHFQCTKCLMLVQQLSSISELVVLCHSPFISLIYSLLDLCTPRTTLLHVDRGLHPCVTGHLQEDVGVKEGV
ncbi:beta-centractin isoform X1 [Salmo salar]|uniref:Beta-centractin isoform X1 n=1 Tax=Salmo salar TaxID=8030 RepID=A0ABM3DVH0_SALSA|nr:beta-centractin isoform X1 [Salmo salar]